jgi:hypothetical protein
LGVGAPASLIIEPVEPEWDESVASLRGRSRVPAALANAELLAHAGARWRGQVVPRTSMHELLFTRPGDGYPFPRAVRVAVEDDGFEFRLIVDAGGRAEAVATKRVMPVAAESTLDEFLTRLLEA